MLKKALASLAALSLMASPVIAQATAIPAAPEPAVERVEGSEMRGGWFVPAAIGVVLLLAILALTDSWPFGDDDPESP